MAIIQITARRDGFRRCGMVHPGKATLYPDDRFSKEDLAVLEAEPMLMVRKITEQELKKAEKEKADQAPSEAI